MGGPITTGGQRQGEALRLLQLRHVRQVGGGARIRRRQTAGLRQSPYIGRRVGRRPNRRCPLLVVTGRPASPPIDPVV